MAAGERGALRGGSSWSFNDSLFGWDLKHGDRLKALHKVWKLMMHFIFEEFIFETYQNCVLSLPDYKIKQNRHN